MKEGWRALAGDEADELRYTLLHRLLRVLRNLRVVRQRFLHDPADVGDGQETVLLPDAAPSLISLLRLRHACGAVRGDTRPAAVRSTKGAQGEEVNSLGVFQDTSGAVLSARQFRSRLCCLLVLLLLPC